MAVQRVLLVPYAGAGVGAFRGWAKGIDASAEPYALQLPGREDRLREPPYRSWAAMIDAAAQALAGWPAMPVTLLGHSLGAVIALALARGLHAARPDEPRHLFVAGRPWPGLPTEVLPDLEALDDAGLMAALDQRYGAAPDSLAHPEIRDLVLPVLRADLCLLDSYRHSGGQPLACPLTVFGGAHDPLTSPDALRAWHTETSGEFHLHMLEAGHFFVDSHRAEMLRELNASLARTADVSAYR
jgi:surfactin synthase thioesterase subunit